MTSHQYLLEVGLEEVPAQYVRPASEQFAERVATFLDENRLAYTSIQSFGTPRRFAVLVDGLAAKAPDFTEIVKGPAKRIAVNEDGGWSKAAEGFVRGKGLTTDDIYFEAIKGEEYVHVKVTTLGQAAADILPGVTAAITDMSFPVSMFWGSHDFKYIRPIHWLVSLLDDAIVPLEVVGVHADRITRGHRFLGAPAITINQAADYEQALAAEYVIADQDKRKQLVVDQIAAIADGNGYIIDLDEGLLEEITQIVEYPTAFLGDFDAKYLQLPEVVLVTSMREHQRYFYVHNQAGALEPHFVAVRNGNDQYLDNVRAGNEKVLVARLEDALFFVHEDKEKSIDDYVKKLEKVTFHAEIGTMTEKTQRVGEIARYLHELWQVNGTNDQSQVEITDAQIARAAQIYKFDLVTGMVDEFSELQGIIGELYALEAGEDPAVAAAIREHYLPTGAEGELPGTPLGRLMAVADKLDTIISFFGINRIPSGSNDPFALRRQMIGIVSILEAHQLYFDWHQDIQNILSQVYQMTDREAKARLVGQLDQFVSDRLKQNLQQKGIRYDIAEAVRASNTNDVNIKIAAAQAIQADSDNAFFKTTMEAWSRILNLREKATELGIDINQIKPELFETDSEKHLHKKVSELEFSDAIAENYLKLAKLTPVITEYFDNNMVFSDNEALRNNRLASLARIAKPVREIADVTLIQTK